MPLVITAGYPDDISENACLWETTIEVSD